MLPTSNTPPTPYHQRLGWLRHRPSLYRPSDPTPCSALVAVVVVVVQKLSCRSLPQQPCSKPMMH